MKHILNERDFSSFAKSEILKNMLFCNVMIANNIVIVDDENKLYVLVLFPVYKMSDSRRASSNSIKFPAG